MQIRVHAISEIMKASTFFATSSNLKSDDLQEVSSAVVQKYLTVVDLTSRMPIESSDQSAMLSVLAERLEGLAQAFGNHDHSDAQDGKANTLAVSELYAW